MKLENNLQKPDKKELGKRLEDTLAFINSCDNIWKEIKVKKAPKTEKI